MSNIRLVQVSKYDIQVGEIFLIRIGKHWESALCALYEVELMFYTLNGNVGTMEELDTDTVYRIVESKR